MAAGFGALYHQNIDAGCDLAQRMLLCANQRCDGHAVLSSHLDHRLRRNAKCVRNQADRVTEGGLEYLERETGIEGLRLTHGNRSRRQLHAMSSQKIAGEVAMFGRDPRLETLPRDVSLA